jgi:hypothetical protein
MILLSVSQDFLLKGRQTEKGLKNGVHVTSISNIHESFETHCIGPVECEKDFWLTDELIAIL